VDGNSTKLVHLLRREIALFYVVSNPLDVVIKKRFVCVSHFERLHGKGWRVKNLDTNNLAGLIEVEVDCSWYGALDSLASVGSGCVNV
jgi:hypothetical protein